MEHAFDTVLGRNDVTTLEQIKAIVEYFYQLTSWFGSWGDFTNSIWTKWTEISLSNFLIWIGICFVITVIIFFIVIPSWMVCMAVVDPFFKKRWGFSPINVIRKLFAPVGWFARLVIWIGDIAGQWIGDTAGQLRGLVTNPRRVEKSSQPNRGAQTKRYDSSEPTPLAKLKQTCRNKLYGLAVVWTFLIFACFVLVHVYWPIDCAIFKVENGDCGPHADVLPDRLQMICAQTICNPRPASRGFVLVASSVCSIMPWIVYWWNVVFWQQTIEEYKRQMECVTVVVIVLPIPWPRWRPVTINEQQRKVRVELLEAWVSVYHEAWIHVFSIPSCLMICNVVFFYMGLDAKLIPDAFLTIYRGHGSEFKISPVTFFCWQLGECIWLSLPDYALRQYMNPHCRVGAYFKNMVEIWLTPLFVWYIGCTDMCIFPRRDSKDRKFGDKETFEKSKTLYAGHRLIRIVSMVMCWASAYFHSDIHVWCCIAFLACTCVGYSSTQAILGWCFGLYLVYLAYAYLGIYAWYCIACLALWCAWYWKKTAILGCFVVYFMYSNHLDICVRISDSQFGRCD